MDSLQREACIFSTMREYDRVDKGGHPLELKSTLDYIDVHSTFAYYSNKVLGYKKDEEIKERDLAFSNY